MWRKFGNENKPGGRLEETGRGSWRPAEPSSMPESSLSFPPEEEAYYSIYTLIVE